MNDEAESNLRCAVAGIEDAAYTKGLLAGIHRLEMLAAVVPQSVTKEWVIEQAGREAKELRKRIVSQRIDI